MKKNNAFHRMVFIFSAIWGSWGSWAACPGNCTTHNLVRYRSCVKPNGGCGSAPAYYIACKRLGCYCEFKIKKKHCGIIIVREGQLFVAFSGNPCLRIYMYIATSVYSSICLIFINTIPNFLPTKLHPDEPAKIWLPTITDIHEQK